MTAQKKPRVGKSRRRPSGTGISTPERDSKSTRKAQSKELHEREEELRSAPLLYLFPFSLPGTCSPLLVNDNMAQALSQPVGLQESFQNCQMLQESGSKVGSPPQSQAAAASYWRCCVPVPAPGEIGKENKSLKQEASRRPCCPSLPHDGHAAERRDPLRYRMPSLPLH